jgi:hypothetical protein
MATRPVSIATRLKYKLQSRQISGNIHDPYLGSDIIALQGGILLIFGYE